jgi:hypothetical protein
MPFWRTPKHPSRQNFEYPRWTNRPIGILPQKIEGDLTVMSFQLGPSITIMPTVHLVGQCGFVNTGMPCDSFALKRYQTHRQRGLRKGVGVRSGPPDAGRSQQAFRDNPPLFIGRICYSIAADDQACW